MNRFFPRKEVDTTRVNFNIRVPQVRVIDDKGEALGVILIKDALRLSQEAQLDLVEVAPNADPPVCRIMDYGKFKYEKSKKQKEAKKKQHTVHLKEIKLHPQTDEHDLAFKLKHARTFLVKGDRVKVTVVFRGREITHLEFGKEMLKKVDEQLQEVAQAEQTARMEGRNMISYYIPDKIKIKTYLRKVELERKAAEQEIVRQGGVVPVRTEEEEPALDHPDIIDISETVDISEPSSGESDA